MATGKILVVKTGFHLNNKYYPAGSTVREGHPIIEGHEELFAPLVVDNEFEAPAQKPPAK